MKYLTVLTVLLALSNAVNADTYFTEVAEEFGFTDLTHSRGTTVIDFNCDGYEDLFLTAFYSQNFLYMNLAGQGFVEVAHEYGLDYSGYSSATASIADVNNDMRPDILVALANSIDHPLLYINMGDRFNEIHEYADLFYVNRGPSCSFVAVRGKTMLDIYSSTTFFAHDGDMTYTDITDSIGLSGANDVYCPNFIDIDGDMDMDMYMALNHTTPGCLFRYENSQYIEITNNTNLDSLPQGEGVTFADYDNDGDPDFFLSAGGDSCSLFNNDGTGYFTEVSDYAGANCPEYNRAAVWGDVNHDGFLDLYVTVVDGGRHDYMLINNGEGRFEDMSVQMGITDSTEQFSVVMLDFDNDGDLDIFTPGIGYHLPLLYRNETNNNNFIKIKLVGGISNRSAIGAQVFLYRGGHLGDPVHLLGSRYVQALSGELSVTSQIIHFGVPEEGPFDVYAAFIGGDPAIMYGVHKGNTYELHSGGIVGVDDDANGQSRPGDFNIEIKCFPTPTNSRVNIEVTADIKSDVVLDMYNIRGQKVRNINMGPVRTTAIESIDVSDLSSGIYFVRPEGAERTSSGKFVLLK
ncbi:MAG: T9SS type A sorting domain-containing protein [candidate division Zixibacteria bacterium]|nr:T9SS type A sorting domain-containing protein [candidate division Zixibacteria bacterium]